MRLMHREKRLLWKPNARQYFATKPLWGGQFYALARTALAIVTLRLPQGEQKFLELWVARNAIYTTAWDYGLDNDWEWQLAGQNFVKVLAEFGALVHFPEPTDETPPPTHTDDFRSVSWFGTPYTFTRMQAKCVRALWEAWERGTPDVDLQTILRAIDSYSARLHHLFDKGRHRAWKTMIQSRRKGTYRLVEPGC
jgi:hypothetical protein